MEINELLSQANGIKNETTPKANTALRVGTLFSDIVQYLEEHSSDTGGGTGEGGASTFAELEGNPLDNPALAQFLLARTLAIQFHSDLDTVSPAQLLKGKLQIIDVEVQDKIDGYSYEVRLNNTGAPWEKMADTAALQSWIDTQAVDFLWELRVIVRFKADEVGETSININYLTSFVESVIIDPPTGGGGGTQNSGPVVVQQDISGTVNIDLSQGTMFILTITGNVAEFGFSNEQLGAEYTFVMKNPGTNRIFSFKPGAFATPFKQLPILTNPTLNESGTSKDIITALCTEPGILDIVFTPNLEVV